MTENMLAGTTHDLTLGFSYNPASQIAGNTRSNDAFAWTAHYGVNRGYTANGLNQYTASGAVTPGYDARGNLISAGGATYAYTAENRMVTSPGGDYNYDPLGRLFMRTATSSFFRHDGGAIITEQDNSSGATRRRYVHGPGVDEPLVWYEGTWTYDRRWLHADERGSIVAVSDDSGAVTAINRYDEYGLPEGPSGAGTLAGQFGYTGQAWLPELGLYYYRARTYSATLGRFLQTDPIGYSGGMNLYAYVLNDPVNFTDPRKLRMRLISIILFSLLSQSCATAAEGPPISPSWCFQEYGQNIRETLTDFNISPVRPDRMADAVRALTERTVIELSREEMEAYLQYPIPSHEKHYLVRGNITTSPGSNHDEIYENGIHHARYEVYWSREQSFIILFVFQSIDGLRQENNVGFILSTSADIDKAYLGCFVTN